MSAYEILNEKLLKGSKKALFYVAVVPVNPMGEVLVAERKCDGIWTTPCGGAELNETPEQTAIRECWEEAGLAIIPSMLEPMGVKMAPDGKPCHCFMVRTDQKNFSVKMDPDREVAEWKWYSRENLPDGLSRQKNANRLETISQALMKFYGLSKSEDKSRAHWVSVGTKVEMEHTSDREKAKKIALDHLAEDPDYYKDWDAKEKILFQEKAPKISKGGEGSGIKGHRTPKKDQIAQLNDLGFAAQDLGQDLDPKHYQHLPEPMRAQLEKIKEVADEYHETDEDSKNYPEVEGRLGDETLKFQQMVKQLVMKKADEEMLSLADALTKGGEGSGVRGHVTAKKIEPHVPHPANVQPEVNKVQAHLNLLRQGGSLPGVNTKSGKPIVTDMNAARSQGYTVDDHVDAMNVHYNMAQKVNAMLEKMKMAGKTPPKEGVEIARFHEKKMQEHMRVRDRMESRVKKQAVHKSTTQMGSGLGDRDINLGSFAQASNGASSEWLEKLHSGMEGFSFGDNPRDFQTDKGVLHLCKVDDGLYTGYFTNQELVGEGMLEDNAKVRIERMTIPELVQFMTAKEWIRDMSVAEVEAPKPMTSEQVGMAYAAEMNRLGDVIERQEAESDLRALQYKLENPQEVSKPLDLSDRIRMLELISKLLG